jgi:hypothetical protein
MTNYLLSLLIWKENGWLYELVRYLAKITHCNVTGRFCIRNNNTSEKAGIFSEFS